MSSKCKLFVLLFFVFARLLHLWRLIVYLSAPCDRNSLILGLGSFLLACMASVSLSCSAESWDGHRVAWTSYVALTKFVRAVQYGAGVGNGPRVSCSRAALAVWIRKLKVVNPRSSDVPSSPSADEAMLDWLVTFVRFGWTPREVLVWFSQFSGIYCSK